MRSNRRLLFRQPLAIFVNLIQLKLRNNTDCHCVASGSSTSSTHVPGYYIMVFVKKNSGKNCLVKLM